MQARVFHHFPGMGSKDVWDGYRENHYPHAMLFLPLSSLGTMDNYRNHVDALDLTRVVMAPYGEHRQARQFERVSLYSGWLRFRDRMVRYLPERVLRQFGWVQTIPRHLVESAPIDVNLAWDYALTPKHDGRDCNSWCGGSREVHRVVLSRFPSTHGSLWHAGAEATEAWGPRRASCSGGWRPCVLTA